MMNAVMDFVVLKNTGTDTLCIDWMQITMSFLMMMKHRRNRSSMKTSCPIQGRRLIRQYS